MGTVRKRALIGPYNELINARSFSNYKLPIKYHI